MEKLYLNDVDVCQEYGLAFTSKVVGLPEAKEMLVSVPLRDGDLDIAQGVFGRAAYGNREVTIELVMLEYDDAVFRLFANEYHGKIAKIRFSDTSDYYLKGRCSLSSSREGAVMLIELSANCEPFLYMSRDDTKTNLI